MLGASRPPPYQGRWHGELLHPGDYVVCADEKPSIQARKRKAATLPATGGDGQKVEHEYERKGALCYLAAWDARRAKIFDRCAPKDGIEPFDALVEQFMSQPPYDRAQRVFMVVDNGSAHRGQRSIDRLQGTWPNLIVAHTPIHASWLNQAEIYFSVVQRKVLTPNDFEDLAALEAHLLAFGRRYEQRSPRPSNGGSLATTSTSCWPRPTPPILCHSPPDTSANFRARPFRLVEGEPLPTSYGQDLYKRIFSVDEVSAAAAHVEDRSGEPLAGSEND